MFVRLAMSSYTYEKGSDTNSKHAGNKMKKLALFASLMVINTASHADLKKHGEALCSKIKSCALVEINKQNLPQEGKDAIISIFDTQCVNSVRKYEVDLGNAGLQEKAKKCLVSLQAQNCDTLMNAAEPVSTPQCDDFETLAKKAGIDVSK